MLITCKSLVVHEFPARECCGRVLWVNVPSGVVGCGSVWLLHCLYVCIASADFLISAVWRKLKNKMCASTSVWGWVKREVKLLKCWNRLLVISAWAVAELLSGFDVSRMAELRLQCIFLLWSSKKVTWNCAAQEAIEMAKPETHYPPRQCPGSRVL